MTGPSRPVVIYRLGSLGDTIVALPCFHAIARALPSARRLVLTNVPVSGKAAPLEGILGGSGLIDGTLAYPVGTRSPAALWRLRAALKAIGADTLIYLTPARGRLAAWRDFIFFRCCGFRHIVGAPLRQDLQRNRRLAPDGRLEHEASRLARCLAPWSAPDLDDRAYWDLKLDDAEESAGRRATAAFGARPYVAINMGGKVARNDWGEQNWLALLALLAARFPEHGLLTVGGAEDLPRAQAAARCWRGPVANGCGSLSPRESAAAMRLASLFIGHDSGPMHLAAAMGVPCIGLFGDNNPPAKWHPFGSAHRVLHRMAGVRTIRVDEVIARVLECLPPSAGDRLPR